MSASLQLAPDTTDLQAAGSALVQRASAVVIVDDETFLLADDIKNECAGRRHAIVKKFADPKRLADEAHKAIRALEKELLDAVEKAESVINVRMITYRNEQKRLAEDERRRLEAIAKKQDEDRKLAEAQDAQDAGDSVGAAAILEEPIVVAPVRVALAVPKTNSQFRETWIASVTDLPALIRFVAKNPQYGNLLIPNMPALNQIARSLKSAAKIDGVVIASETNVASGRR